MSDSLPNSTWGRILSPVTRLSNGLAMGANVIGTLVVLILVLVLNYDTAATKLFNAPFRGTNEVVQFSMVLIVFLQLPDVARVDRLTRSDGFLLVLGGRFPAVTRWLRRFIDSLSCVFMILIAVAIFPEFLDMWDTQDFFGIPGVFTAPWWPVKLAIFISAVLCAIIFALKVLKPAPPSSAASVTIEQGGAS